MYDCKRIVFSAVITSLLTSNVYGGRLRRTQEVLGPEGCTYVEADVQYEKGNMPTGPKYLDSCILSSGQLVDIDGLTNEFKSSNLNDGLSSGDTTLFIPGATIENGILTVPNGASINAEKLRGNEGINANVAGTKMVFVIRADAPDAQVSTNVAQLSDKVFGTSGDMFNLKSQFASCSYNTLMFEPVSATFNGESIAAGVGEVTLTSNINGVENNVVRNDMLAAADAKYGSIAAKVLSGEIDYVMLCIPPGTAGSWIAYAYINSYISVYNNNWCSYLSTQMHEMGHNLGLAHSGEASTYDDQSGMMGYSYSIDEGPAMCFNGVKSWQLGWYSNGRESISPLSTSATIENSFVGRLVGAAEYNLLDTTSTDKVLIQVTGYATDYYVAFNRQVGINSGTVEGGNQVLVHSRSPGQYYDASTILAKLSSGESYTITGSQDTTITVNSINTSASPGYADVGIVGPNTDSPVTPPTIAPVTPPTTAPFTPPTNAPLTPPTTAPVTTPTTSPVTTPTNGPVTPPTPGPFGNVPTPFPTGTAPTPFPTGAGPTPFPTSPPVTSHPTEHPVQNPPTEYPTESPPTLTSSFPTHTPPTMHPTHNPPTMHPTNTPPTPFPTESPPTPFPTDIPPTSYPTKFCAIRGELCTKHKHCCSKKCNKKKSTCRK